MGLQGERRKDDKHATNVGMVGGVFVPLVVETLELWTPFALQCLSRSIQNYITQRAIS